MSLLMGSRHCSAQCWEPAPSARGQTPMLELGCVALRQSLLMSSYDHTQGSSSDSTLVSG